jgi:hypothetical protein
MRTGVNLRLSNEEAVTLATVLRQVSGDRANSARLHAGAISSALADAAIPHISLYHGAGSGQVHLTPESLEEINEVAADIARMEVAQ